MAKDPAMLFYVSDFITGTMFMSNEQVGIYIRLLCSQHQHGGFIDKDNFTLMVGDHKLLRGKFVETDDGFYNERLMKEMVKRSKKSSNMSDNAMIRWNKQKQCKGNAIAMQLKDKDKDRDKDIKEIIDDLNTVLSTSFKSTSRKTRELIKARMAERYTVEDFKTVHRKKAYEWQHDNKMVKFLRPETLYSNKFEGYLNQKEVRTLTKGQQATAESYRRWKEKVGDEPKNI